MSVRLTVQTDFGPYQRGTILVTTVYHAERIISAYGRGVSIVDRSGRPSRPYTGANLFVIQERRPYPGPQVEPRTDVTFNINIGRYVRGNTYRLSADEIDRLMNHHRDMAIFTAARVPVPRGQIRHYVRRGVHLFADRELVVYAM